MFRVTTTSIGTNFITTTLRFLEMIWPRSADIVVCERDKAPNHNSVITFKNHETCSLPPVVLSKMNSQAQNSLFAAGSQFGATCRYIDATLARMFDISRC